MKVTACGLGRYPARTALAVWDRYAYRPRTLCTMHTHLLGPPHRPRTANAWVKGGVPNSRPTLLDSVCTLTSPSHVQRHGETDTFYALVDVPLLLLRRLAPRSFNFQLSTTSRIRYTYAYTQVSPIRKRDLEGRG